LIPVLLGFRGGIEAVKFRRHDSAAGGTIMTTTVNAWLSGVELEARYEAAAEPVAKSHFHALWLLSCGYEIEEVAELLSFSPRWVRELIRRYNEGGAEMLGDQRIHNGTPPTILTPAALTALKDRIKTPPDDGGLWTGPKIARWLARFHGLKSVHDQRGWDALIAIGYSIQQPRPRHPAAATETDRAALKKNSWPQRPRNGAGSRARRSKSGRWTSTASV
jgi:transposase